MIVLDAGAEWYVAAVESRSEAQAASLVSRTGFPVYLPLERRLRVLRGRRAELATPVFAGYLFVGFDRDRDDWGRVCGCRGVIDVVRSGIRPVPVPARVMARIQNADAAGVFDRRNQLPPGAEVEITEGPFRGLLAKVRSATPAKRMKILLAGLGTLEIEPHYLRRA